MRVCRYLAISHVIRFWCWAQLGLLLPRTVPMLDQCPAQVGGKLYQLGPGRRMFRSSSCRVWPSLAQVGLCSTQCSSYHTPQLPKAIPTQFSFPFPAYIFVHVYIYIYMGVVQNYATRKLPLRRAFANLSRPFAPQQNRDMGL